ncbi:13514_t:CDS:2, partial [Acaulospora colombiana]
LCSEESEWWHHAVSLSVTKHLNGQFKANADNCLQQNIKANTRADGALGLVWSANRERRHDGRQGSPSAEPEPSRHIPPRHVSFRSLEPSFSSFVHHGHGSTPPPFADVAK